MQLETRRSNRLRTRHAKDLDVSCGKIFAISSYYKDSDVLNDQNMMISIPMIFRGCIIRVLLQETDRRMRYTTNES